MTILSDQSIREYLLSGHIIIEPRPKDSEIQPSSVDLRLGSGFLGIDGEVLGTDTLVLRSGDFALASVYERITIPNFLVGKLDGKSSFGRNGILIHVTAGYCDPGYYGNLTLEISNLSRKTHTLRSGMLICQIHFETMTTPALRSYGHPELNSHYQGAVTVQKSVLDLSTE